MQDLPFDCNVYTCGPEPMLNAVLDAGRSMRGGKIHFERFAAAAGVQHAKAEGFEIELKSSGAVFQVGAEDTILSVLQANDVPVEFGCSDGLCGSCIVDVVVGEVDHRDGILTPEEKADNAFLCTCVSRARSDRLVLDL